MNVYEIVTNRILEELDKGIIPWRRPWRTQGLPLNYVSRRPYNGINRLLLNSGEYLTFKQIQERKGHIKKGAKAHIVVFWKQLTVKEEETGEDKTVPMLRYYNVFSLADVEGIDSKLEPIVIGDVDPIPEAEELFQNYLAREQIELCHNDLNRAFYRPSADIINMPLIGQFNVPEEYYSTAFHEASHSTGHEKRLNRINKHANFGDELYSKEELIAEISSAIICDSVGIDLDKTIKNTTAYIRSWSNTLKQDPHMAVLAAGKAEKAASFVLGQTEKKGEEGECQS